MLDTPPPPRYDTCMRTIWIIFGAHVLLLILAATRFSVISWLWGDASWNWSYFTYSSRSGFGYEYVSDYSLPRVFAYLAGYAIGLPVFIFAVRRRWMLLGWFGIILCGLGVASFGIESSHWLWRHHTSWIASFPAAMAVLWVIWVLRVGKQGKELRANANE